MKGPFLALDARKGPFMALDGLALGAVKGPFLALDERDGPLILVWGDARGDPSLAYTPGVVGVLDSPLPPVLLLEAPMTFGDFDEVHWLWSVALMP